jgi:hypothetical protein
MLGSILENELLKTPQTLFKKTGDPVRVAYGFNF